MSKETENVKSQSQDTKKKQCPSSIIPMMIESTLIKKPHADHPAVTVMREEWLTDVQDWMPECRHNR